MSLLPLGIGKLVISGNPKANIFKFRVSDKFANKFVLKMNLKSFSDFFHLFSVTIPKTKDDFHHIKRRVALKCPVKHTIAFLV
jgi:hypothetical protein